MLNNIQIKLNSRISRFLLILLLPIAIVFNSCGDDGGVTPVNDGSTQPFENIPATEDIVMYEVNFRAFSSSGDFKGVTDKLDHIKSLGVNVIWLMPIHPIGNVNSVNSPYSVKNYKEVNPELGNLDDFKKLVNESHKKDMAVIIDWVANHTAWDNPWIQNKAWYTQNASGNIIIPPGTNWQDVADLNFDNEEMRLEMIDALKYWVTELNVDGFRCDAADFVPYSFWRQAIDSLENIDDRQLIYLAEGARTDHYNAGFQMTYSWDFYGKLKNVFINKYNASSIFSTHTNEYKIVPEGKHKLRFITNHDESAWDETPVDLFGGTNGSFSAFIISTYLGGVPLIYGSQEFGIEGNVSFFDNVPFNWSSNPELLKDYQKLMSIYNKSDVLRKGNLKTFSDPDIAAFTKAIGNEEFLILVNVRNRFITYSLPNDLKGTNWTDEFNGESISLDADLEFDPFQFYILKK
ncbi:MAG: hypothetical protein JEY94_05810 [Melioribacteraceae bacterium]|nr:hypothetical protein [Melioribacteraceae bacterium]